MKRIMSDQLAREHQLILKSLGDDEQELEDLNDVIGKSTPSKHLTRSEKKRLLNGNEEKDEKEPAKAKDEVKKIKIVKDGQVELVDKSEILSPLVKKPAESEREVKIEENKEGDMVMKIDTQKKKKNKKKIKGGEKKESEEPKQNLTGQKRVHFDLSQNQVTEFFKHGKVAQRVLEIQQLK